MCRPTVAAALCQAAPVLASQGAGARQPGPASTTGLSSQRIKPLTSVAARRSPSQCSTACGAMYEQALELAREGEFEAARRAFQELTQNACPTHEKAWVSWAQMEKRCSCVAGAAVGTERFARCREVLQRALSVNPTSAALCQAWGLLELQKGNWLAAVLLLERSVAYDHARCAPVLRWAPVRKARMTVSARRGSKAF